jgi:hypothetical protein
MTGDALYTLVILLAGGFSIFLCAIWFIESEAIVAERQSWNVGNSNYEPQVLLDTYLTNLRV